MLGSILEFLRCAVGIATVIVGIFLAWQWHKESLEECER